MSDDEKFTKLEFRADRGRVAIEDPDFNGHPAMLGHMTRLGALEAMESLSYAIQMSGDMCDPDTVLLHAEIKDLLEKWRKE